jgi:hypothetical protein
MRPPVQRLPHIPQSLVVVMSVSQPFRAEPSQLSQPASHAPITQLPVAQDSDACEMSQTIPHPPQLASVAVEVSQPSEAVVLQSWKPAAHANPHAPLAQKMEAFARVGQLIPHIPQSVVLVAVFTSHPSVATPLQSRYVELHVKPHVPVLHMIVAFARAGHGFPQAPQCDRLDWMSASQPSDVMELQSRKLPMQAYVQLPALHEVVALGRAPHAIPHMPQFDVSVAVSASQPSDAIPLQLPHPLTHMKPHIPPVQLRVAFAGDGHVFIHAPQCERFVAVLISQPSPAVALQSS